MAGEFTAAGQALIADLTQALHMGAVDVMSQADFLIPKDTETARESARIFPAKNDGASVTIQMGFGFGGAINPKTGNPVDMYIVPLHEIAEAFHEPPTQFKFLEAPVLGYAGEMEKSIGSELKATWGRT